jgi:hypothetical protein
MDKQTAENLLATLKTEIRAPYVSGYVSTLGGEQNSSILLTISLDKRENWISGILENSRYAKFHVSDKIEHFSGYGTAKFRKASFQSPVQLVEKLQLWVNGATLVEK